MAAKIAATEERRLAWRRKSPQRRRGRLAWRRNRCKSPIDAAGQDVPPVGERDRKAVRSKRVNRLAAEMVVSAIEKEKERRAPDAGCILSDEVSRWPSTKAENGDGKLSFEADQFGVLGQAGYRVGTTRESQKARGAGRSPGFSRVRSRTPIPPAGNGVTR